MYFLLIILLSALSTEAFLYSQNSLMNNDSWLVDKRRTEVSVNGASEFLTDRSSLARNQINLSSFYGNQSITFKKDVEMESIKFSFQLEEYSHLDFYVKGDVSPYWGIRLNHEKAGKSFIFKVNEEGKFVFKKDIEAFKLSSHWHHLFIDFSTQRVNLRLDKLKLEDFKVENFSFGRPVFRGASHGTILDDIILKNLDGDYYTETFRRIKGWKRIFIFFVILMPFLIEALRIMYFFFRKEKSNELGWDFRLLISSQLILCLLIYHLFDFNFFSKYPYFHFSKDLVDNSHIEVPVVERIRFRSLNTLANILKLNHDVLKYHGDIYPQGGKIFNGPILCSSKLPQCLINKNKQIKESIEELKTCKKFVLIGTSQSIGAGASRFEKSIFFKIHKRLVDNFEGQCITSLNLSISGGKVSDGFEIFSRSFEMLKPDLMIFNIGNNDSLEEMSKFLPIIAEYCQKNKIKLMITEEPTRIQKPRNISSIEDKILYLRKIASESAIITYKLHDHLKEIAYDKGFVWWDVVHMTDYGQDVAAKWISEQIISDNLLQ